jgi:hypothetical protein
MQPAFATTGAIFGPFVSGLVVERAAFGGLGLYTMAIFAVGAALMAAATINADNNRNAAALA